MTVAWSLADAENVRPDCTHGLAAARLEIVVDGKLR